MNFKYSKKLQGQKVSHPRSIFCRVVALKQIPPGTRKLQMTDPTQQYLASVLPGVLEFLLGPDIILASPIGLVLKTEWD